MHCHLNPTDDHVHRKVACVTLNETQLDVVCESIFMFSHVEDLKFAHIKDPQQVWLWCSVCMGQEQWNLII